MDIQSKSITFKGASPARKNQNSDFLEKVEKTANTHNDIFVKRLGEEPPVKRIKKAKKNAAKGIGLAALSLLGLAGTIGGAKSFSNYNDARDEISHTVTVNQKVETSWNEVAEAANTIEETSGFDNPELVGRYNEKMDGLIIKLMQTIREETNDSGEVQVLDEELLKQLERNTDFMPHKNAQQVALEFTQFMEQELSQEYGVAPENALSQQIETINIEMFLNGHPAFRDLNSLEKSDLAEELTLTYTEERAFPTSTYFTDAINGAIDTGITGADIESFAMLTEGNAIATESDAIALFKNIVNNNENFEHLTSGQRQALINRGTEVLSSLEYDSPSALWGVGAFALASVSALGGLGLIITRRKDLTEALQSPVDFYKGLTSSTLVVEETNTKGNPEAKRHLSIFYNEIKHYASEIEQLINKTYQENPEAKEILDGIYKQGQLPDTESIVQQFIYNTKVALIKSRNLSDRLSEKPVSEIAFAQQVHQAIEEAYQSGNYLYLGLPEGMINPSSAESIDKNSTPMERLQAEQRKAAFQIGENRKFLVNQMFAVAQAQSIVDKINKEYDILKTDLKNGASDTEVLPKVKQLEVEKTQAEEKLNHVSASEQNARIKLGATIAKLQAFQNEVAQLILKEQSATNMMLLNELANEAKAHLESQSLQELIERAELELHIKEAKNEQEKIAREFTEALNTRTPY